MKKINIIIISLSFITVCLADSVTRYVSKTGNSISPYENWENAATNIQFAVDVANDGDIVLVGPGTYFGKREEVSGSMVKITKGITLESVAGPEVTMIDAIGYHRRAIYINHPDAVVRGLYLYAGFARTNIMKQSYPVSCGGGVFFDGGGLVENCIFCHNFAGLKGGSVYMEGGGHLRNCLIFYGEAPECGGIYCNQGGLVENCTIVDNWTTSTNAGGGLWCVGGGEVINTLLYNNPNTKGSAVDVMNSGGGWSYIYSRVPVTVPGEGNVQYLPQFKDPLNDFSLMKSSLCRNIGTNLAWMIGYYDLNQSPRISDARVDIGAYEFMTDSFVSLAGSHRSPFSDWKTAATNIMAAVSRAEIGAQVNVSNGTYFVSQPIDINKLIKLKSFSGLTLTEINGQDRSGCMRLDSEGAQVSGFTFTHGASTNEQISGINIRAGELKDCLIKNCVAPRGGGILLQGGQIINSEIINCTAFDGGGGMRLEGGFASNVFIDNCRSMGSGGGVSISAGKIEYSTIKNCYSANFGGGINISGESSVKALIICNNYSAWAGGGVMLEEGILRDCLIVSNTTAALPIVLAGNMQMGGGGIFSLPSGQFIQNCTITDNVSSNRGGGIFDLDFMGSGATNYIENTILYDNVAVVSNANYVGASLRFLNSCTWPTVPVLQDAGQLVYSAPQFEANYQLAPNSLCRGAGRNESWMLGAKDLAGNPRIVGGKVDIGAYEALPEPGLALGVGFMLLLIYRKIRGLAI